MLRLDVNADSLQRIALDIMATEQQAERALRSTLGKMAAWLRVRSLRGLAPHLQVTQKVLRRRLKSFRLKATPGGGEITVWYGLDPIGLIYLGAKQTGAGVTAGAHKRKSAFIANGRNGNRQVFKRTGKARLPIEKQTLDVQEKAQTYIEDKLLGTAGFEAQFFKTFEHELQWQTRTQK
ncbi:hypothetical protein CPT_Mano_008 [Achromobacter phage Mano]|uniref:Minor tail protein n=1 Tax=Achromobacter phage Mano TaxID=2767570 RepID=A0A7L8G7E5_9CAUD|nr:tail completion or Neck1 protein [Achromobacter phage Mano]QOE32741.1 hypothetical protein CPT_Mano_008 [Achromobacter phage Mano]